MAHCQDIDKLLSSSLEEVNSKSRAPHQVKDRRVCQKQKTLAQEIYVSYEYFCHLKYSYMCYAHYEHP